MTLTQKRAQASFKTRLLLHLANRRRRKGAEAFTLVELMIVVAVIGILSAVALPAFLGARGAAELGAKVGETLGTAKECATFAASGGVGASPTGCSTSGGTFTGTSSQTASGVTCLSAKSNANSTVTVTVTSSGGLSCSFS